MYTYAMQRSLALKAFSLNIGEEKHIDVGRQWRKGGKALLLVSLMDGGVAMCCSATLKPSEALQEGSTRKGL